MAEVSMVGATGLIGRTLAPLLVAAGHELLVLGRRAAWIAGAREKLGPAERWPGLMLGEACDIAVSTLGTTRRKAGSWAAFEAIDRTALVEFARAAHRDGARQFILVSSVGANPRARNRYLALKGKVEDQIAAIGFERFDALRPGLLVGKRTHDRRLGERLGIFVSPLVDRLLRGRLKRYRSIRAERVARAMAALAGAAGKGRFVHHNAEIEALAPPLGS